MLCPEGTQYQKDSMKKEEETYHKKNKVPADGSGSLDLNSFKHPRNWKKSISSFFRGQLRSTKSNDGDRPSGSKETFHDKQISPEQNGSLLVKFSGDKVLQNTGLKPRTTKGKAQLLRINGLLLEK